MKSLRLRVALWFTASMMAVMAVYLGVTYFHLRHELRFERIERAHPDHKDWSLHGSYSESEVDDITGEFWRISLLYTVPVFIAALVIGYGLAKRSMGAVDELSRQLADINARNLKRRVQLPGADKEFAAIESNINSLLTRLESSFAQLTEYSATVAHELRTPLTLMKLKIEDASGRMEPEMAEALNEELARLTDYVDQCLLLATAEQGRLVLHPEDFKLSALLEEIIEPYQLWSESLGRAVNLVIKTDFAVSSDRKYLKQVLHNLLSNAIKHGSGPIVVTLEETSTSGICRIENLVNPKPAATRTGLGLRIVRALVHFLGGGLELSEANGWYRVEIQWLRAGGHSTVAQYSAKLSQN